MSSWFQTHDEEERRGGVQCPVLRREGGRARGGGGRGEKKRERERERGVKEGILSQG